MKYTVTLHFTNLDNFMGTDEQASMTIAINADDERHANLLAQRLQKVMDADHYQLVKMYKEP